MARYFALLGFAVLLSAGCSRAGTQSSGSQASAQTIQTARLEKAPDRLEHPLFAVVGKEEKKVADNATEFWLAEDKKTLYYSYNHKLSGFEREGQGVMRWQPGMPQPELIFNDDEMISDFKEVKSSSGKIGLLIHFQNGGSGGSTVVIANPETGRVFRSSSSSAEDDGSGKINLATYDNQELAEWQGEGKSGYPPPLSTETWDIDELLGMDGSRDVIVPMEPGEPDTALPPL